MESTIFKTEIVNGKCPHCNFDVVLISLASDHFRCTTCGSDLEQKVNGVISYIPIMSSTSKNKVEFPLSTGSTIISNNYFWLHGRKPFKEHKDLSRELLRIRGSFFKN